MRNKLAAPIIAAFFLAGLSPLPAGAVPSGTSLSARDRAFLRQASESNLLQMQLEGVVMRKTRSARDREFARRQAAVRRTAQNDLESFAAGLGAAVGVRPTAAEQRVIDRLGGTPRHRFSMTYRQVEARRLAIDIQQARHEAESGRSRSVRAYAKKLLPALTSQLRLARGSAGRPDTGRPKSG
jgi:hypothetical protein